MKKLLLRRITTTISWLLKLKLFRQTRRRNVKLKFPIELHLQKSENWRSINDTDDNDIAIIENDTNTVSTADNNIKAKSKRKISEDDDCLIVHDDNMQSSAVSQ